MHSRLAPRARGNWDDGGSHDYLGEMNGFSIVAVLGSALALHACASAPRSAAREPCAEEPEHSTLEHGAKCEAYVANPERIARLRAIQADGGRIPANGNVLSLSQELVSLLADPDPEVRDGLAFELLYTWVQQQRLLSADALKALGAQLEPALRVPSAEPSSGAAPAEGPDPCVFGRSFAALALSLIVARDVDEGFLSAQELHAQVEMASRYAGEERDLRGFTGEHGWAHAAAHTADWLLALSRHPSLTQEDAQRVLGAVSHLLLRPHGFVLHHGEDGRLAQPVLTLLRRDAVATSSIDAWVAEFLEPLREPMSADPRQPLYARQRNARNMLFTLFVALSLEQEPSAAAQSALSVVRKVLTSA